MEISQLQLSGLGTATGTATTLPTHYLVPMTELEIDGYIFQHHEEICSSCTEWPKGPCCDVFIEIERNNLLFVNNFITHDQLLQAYAKAADNMAHIPRLPGIREQLKNSGKFIVGAVSGFLAAGPIGMFVGSASVIGKIIADEKKRMAAKINSTLTQNIQTAQSAAGQIEQNKVLKYAGLGAGVIAVSGILYWMFYE